MQSEWTLERFRDAEGYDVYDLSGEKVGTVDEVYYDLTTGRPEWLSVGTGFLRMSKAVIPVEGAEVGQEGITIPFDKDRVRNSPDVGKDEITVAEERELCSYYGITHSTTDTAHLDRWEVAEPMPEGAWTTR